jgi:hypothetical protein
MSVFTQRALLYARDSLKVYRGFRKRAKVLVAELQRGGIKQVYLQGEGEDEILDILRLTCIEAGMHLSETPNDVMIMSDGQDYRVKIKEQSSDAVRVVSRKHS